MGSGSRTHWSACTLPWIAAGGALRCAPPTSGWVAHNHPGQPSSGRRAARPRQFSTWRSPAPEPDRSPATPRRSSTGRPASGPSGHRATRRLPRLRPAWCNDWARNTRKSRCESPRWQLPSFTFRRTRNLRGAWKMGAPVAGADERSQRPATSSPVRDEPSAAAAEFLFCAGCAREISGGAVIVRGTRYCSPECSLAAAVPGHYIG